MLVFLVVLVIVSVALIVVALVRAGLPASVPKWQMHAVVKSFGNATCHSHCRFARAEARMEAELQAACRLYQAGGMGWAGKRPTHGKHHLFPDPVTGEAWLPLLPASRSIHARIFRGIHLEFHWAYPKGIFDSLDASCIMCNEERWENGGWCRWPGLRLVIPWILKKSVKFQ